MLALTLSGIIEILKSCIIMFGYIQSSQLFPEPLTPEEEKIFLERLSRAVMKMLEIFLLRET